MRALIGLAALIPVAVMIGVLLRSRIQARVRARANHWSDVEDLLQERAEIEARATVDELRRELDVAIAREEKKKSRGKTPQDAA